MIEIPITLNSDEKGYFDRECPNTNCLFTFKVFMDDWKEKVSDEEVHCPMCGHVDTSDKWWTQAQLDGINEVASNWAMFYIQNELDKSFKKLERSTHGNKFIKITYKPGHRTTFMNNPLGQSDEWEQEIQCPDCQTRYSVIGTAYFCPCCGHDVIEDIFDKSLDGILKMIESLPQMQELLSQTYGKDTAVSMCKSMLEGSLGDVLSAFQKFAEVRYKTITNKTVRVNDFQIIEKGSKLFEEACGAGYSSWLTTNEIELLSFMFQKRHLYEHNGGIVDNTYIKKSGDSTFKQGQRMVIKESEVLTFIKIVKKLADGIKAAKAMAE